MGEYYSSNRLKIRKMMVSCVHSCAWDWHITSWALWIRRFKNNTHHQSFPKPSPPQSSKPLVLEELLIAAEDLPSFEPTPSLADEEELVSKQTVEPVQVCINPPTLAELQWQVAIVVKISQLAVLTVEPTVRTGIFYWFWLSFWPPSTMQDYA